MTLPDSYTQKPGAMPEYFRAILDAQAPERFTQKFLEVLDFKSTNDRLFIGILKDLGFLDTDGVPTERYFRFHDRSQWEKILSEGIREAYSDLFAVNQKAYEMSVEDVTNKLRTLYAGSKTDQVIARIARTFTSLCELADFSDGTTHHQTNGQVTDDPSPTPPVTPPVSQNAETRDNQIDHRRVGIRSLQYHINIVLPESKDQAVYDAIFKSLKQHLDH